MDSNMILISVLVLLSLRKPFVLNTSLEFIETSRPSIEKKGEYYTNLWAVRILGGVDVAKGVADNLGFHFPKRLSEGLRDIYLFHNVKYPKKSYFPDVTVTKNLLQHPQITWTEQQVAEKREVRRYSFRKRHTRTFGRSPGALVWDNSTDAYACPSSNDTNGRALNLNDKLWPKQYYLRDCRQNTDGQTHDLNVAPVWVKHRLFGKNIKVILVDDGLLTTHEELADNYDPALGLDLQDEDYTPDPKMYKHILDVPLYSHGTGCAGIIAMKPNNTRCGVGIAPLVTLGSVRYFGPKPMTDFHRATALTFKHVEAHIMSNSWGKVSDGKMMSRMSTLTRMALKVGITEGRQGRGLIYIFAAGNGRGKGDVCSCDSMIINICTIAVASCDHKGRTLYYSERCPSVMVTTYSSSYTVGVVTAFISRSNCTSRFGGTSASAPMVSAAVALALEANPNLSWRDVQHLLAWTCQVAPLKNNPPGTWIKNGAGFYVSHDFGFGMLDINGLVEKSKDFSSVGPMNTCVTKATVKRAEAIFRSQIKVEIASNGCEGTPSEVKYLEHVELTVTVEYPRRGDLQISLISPSGTEVNILERRRKDSSPSGIHNWTFDSVLTWGEPPQGKWTVIILGSEKKENRVSSSNLFGRSLWISWTKKRPGERNRTVNLPNLGKLMDLTLTFHGTSRLHEPHHYKAGSRAYDHFTLLDK